MSYIGNQPTSTAFVTDTFSGNGTTTAFTMSVAPAGTTSLLVAITGVVQDPSAYSVTGTTLTFSSAPPTGTGNISVRYLGIPASGVTTTAYRTVTEFTATAGQTTFTPPSYTVGYLNVYRNGVLLGSADYTATNGTTVVLAAAASAGDLVTTESFYVSSVLNAIPASPSSVGTSYLVDESVTTAKIDDASVTQAKLAAGVAGNGPAFLAFTPGNQSIANVTNVKLTFSNDSTGGAFDTNNCYDTTNYRFVPNVAGYYQISLVGALTVASGLVQIGLFKNGSQYVVAITNANSNGSAPAISVLMYFNGSTDYVEGYLYQNSGGTATTLTNRSDLYQFSGVLVRAA